MLSRIIHWLGGLGRAGAWRAAPDVAQPEVQATTPPSGNATGVSNADRECSALVAGASRAARQSERDPLCSDSSADDSEPTLGSGALIARGVRIFGTVEYESGAGLRIDGVVIGNVIARNLDLDRCVTIGSGAMIVGDVWAHRVRVDGVIEGTLTAEECEIAGQVSGGVRSVLPPRLQGAAARVFGPTAALTEIEFPERHQLVQRDAQSGGERLVNQIGAMEALQTLSNVRGVERSLAPRAVSHAAPSPARPAGRLQAQIRAIERDLAAGSASAINRANSGSQPTPMKPE